MAVIILQSWTKTSVDYVVDTVAKTCTCPYYVNRLAARNANNPPEEWVLCKHITQALEQEAQACN